MKIKFNSLFLILIGYVLLALYSCKETVIEDKGIPVEEMIKGLDPEKLSNFMLVKVKKENFKPVGAYDDRFTDTLNKWYIERDGNTVWLSFLKDSSVRANLKSTLFSMDAHGLPNKFYNGKLILKYLDKFDALKEITSDEDYNFLTDLDYLISLSVINISKDLALGRVDPHKFYKPFFEMTLTRQAKFNLFSVLKHPRHFHDTLTLYQPWSIKYHKLQLLYKHSMDYIKQNEILYYDTSLDKQSEHNQKVIDQRLELLWLTETDSLPILKKRISNQRDNYISKTRQLFGLSGNGIDSAFVNDVCGPVTDITDNVLVSLERERWFSIPDTGKFVYVNLIEYYAQLHNDSLKQMKVCVGKRKVANYDEKYQAYLKTKNARAKPVNSETPIISSRIREIVINPTWTVPNSIIGKEMYHQIVANPNYLTRKGFEVVKDGKVVSPTSINWKQYKPYGVVVKIRQKAGSNNSLGVLKFNFPNGHNIYMHDTPEKGKFNQENRAVSHGCIRLHHPVEMAEFILGLQQDSSIIDKFRLKMGLQPYDTALQIADSLLKPIKKTESIRLKYTVPVYIDYKTITTNSSGNLVIHKDIYRKNKALAKKLKQ